MGNLDQVTLLRWSTRLNLRSSMNLTTSSPWNRWDLAFGKLTILCGWGTTSGGIHAGVHKLCFVLLPQIWIQFNHSKILFVSLGPPKLIRWSQILFGLPTMVVNFENWGYIENSFGYDRFWRYLSLGHKGIGGGKCYLFCHQISYTFPSTKYEKSISMVIITPVDVGPACDGVG